MHQGFAHPYETFYKWPSQVSNSHIIYNLLGGTTDQFHNVLSDIDSAAT